MTINEFDSRPTINHLKKKNEGAGANSRQLLNFMELIDDMNIMRNKIGFIYEDKNPVRNDETMERSFLLGDIEKKWGKIMFDFEEEI